MNTSALARDYRDAYDEQIRTRIVDGDAVAGTVEKAGPAFRMIDQTGRGAIVYRDLAGLQGAELDRFIEDQCAFFDRLGKEAEWKHHGHDLPADLPARLTAAGLVSQPAETIMIGTARQQAESPRPPKGVRLREVAERADLERIQDLEERVWGTDHRWLPDALERALGGVGDPTTVVVAETTTEVVCAAWAVFHEGTDFVSLWGGSTLPEWRGRGIYRACVAFRATQAAEREFRYLQVDASAASKPILTHLGLLPVTTTTPYLWTPRAA